MSSALSSGFPFVISGAGVPGRVVSRQGTGDGYRAGSNLLQMGREGDTMVIVN